MNERTNSYSAIFVQLLAMKVAFGRIKEVVPIEIS